MTHPAIRLALREWRANRSAFQDLLEARHRQADDELSGNLLNSRGRSAGIDSISLFYGPWVRVKAYASEELLAWFDDHGWTTFEAFEAELTEYPGRCWGELIQDWETGEI